MLYDPHGKIAPEEQENSIPSIRGKVVFRRMQGYTARLGTKPTEYPLQESEAFIMAMHYPRRVSRIKRVRDFGFRARMKTRLGRKLINRKRSKGRRLTPL